MLPNVLVIPFREQMAHPPVAWNIGVAVHKMDATVHRVESCLPSLILVPIDLSAQPISLCVLLDVSEWSTMETSMSLTEIHRSKI